MAAKKTGPVVHVIFDTSCLFVHAADKLIGDEIGEFVLSTNAGLEIDVRWHLPQLAVDERKYQMNLRANRLLPHIEKVEKLLGHNLAITPEILKGGVDSVIERELERHSLKVLELDTQSVGWPELIQRAVTRRPPFEEKQEKGFRDAVILETFCQLVEKLPKSTQSCRIVFVCGDVLLAKAAGERVAGRTNVVVTAGLSDLKTMLNALASHLTDATLGEILPLATAIFLDSKAKKGLWYSENLGEKIPHQYADILYAPPWPDFTAQVSGILLSFPVFLTKKGQTLTFSSRLTYEMEAKKIIWRNPPPPSLGSPLAGPLFGSSTESVSFGGVLGTPPPSPDLTMAGSSPDAGMGLYPWLTPPLPSSPPQLWDEIRRTGEHVFEVTWSVVLTARGKLRKAKVDRIEHKGTNWEEPS